MKNIVKKLTNRFRKRIFAVDIEKSFLRNFQHPEIAKRVKNEDLYIQKWRGLGLDVNPVYYRVYTNYAIGIDINLVPIDLYYLVIQKKLNNYVLALTYADKNMYNKWFDSGLLPKTYLRNINGAFYTAGYKAMKPDFGFLNSLSAKSRHLIVKPSIESGSGVNVKKFQWKGNAFYDDHSIQLSVSYLEENYRQNYLVQEMIIQHPYLQRLNKSSVNTLRILTFRSAKDEEVHILGSYLRIGKNDSLVDNISSGGYLISFDERGWPDKNAVSNKEGKIDSVNGIRVSEIGIYPEYQKLIRNAKDIARSFPYQRMLGLDLVLDNANCVKLIEVNTFKIGPFAYSGYPIFGKYTDEIIEYCMEKAKKEAIN
jgi:hypothetical protein